MVDEDFDDDLDMLDFGAGIEDSTKNPPPIVRSVSPSSLEGLSLPAPRPPTPPRSPPSHLSPDPDSATDDDEDEHEDYFRFGIGRLHSLSLPFSLRDYSSMRAKKAAKAKSGSEALLSPTSHPSFPSNRGRPVSAHHGGMGMRPTSSPRPRRRVSPHAWREPSPDVFAIREETAEEINSDLGSSMGAEDVAARRVDMKSLPAALKPTDGEGTALTTRKRVRFVLPGEEMAA